jgi:hypothetical protein
MFLRRSGVWALLLAVAIVIPRWSRCLIAGAGISRERLWLAGRRGRSETRIGDDCVFLPHQAWLSADAIVRVFHRKWISKRNLLEWKTAQATENGSSSHSESHQRQMQIIGLISTVALVILASRGAFVVSFAFLGLWIISPWLERWLARPEKQSWIHPIGRSETADLRNVARRTWRYFDDLIGPQSHWLPPDNSQLALNVEVARRTSPTNIGLWLNSALAAHDFGYLTADDFVRRCSATMETLGKLERYEGHLLNWYDTNTLAPLPPQYVSTVDSGNLIASLWVLAQGCRTSSNASRWIFLRCRPRLHQDPAFTCGQRSVAQCCTPRVAGPCALQPLSSKWVCWSHGIPAFAEAMRWNAETGDETRTGQ